MFTVFYPIENCSASGNTIYVDGDGGKDYTSIQSAINNASKGDTVFVYSGTYYEHITISKKLFLMGENRVDTIIDGNNISERVVYITADDVCISGFTLRNSRKTDHDDAGIFTNSHYINISNNIIKNNRNGIYMDYLWYAYENLTTFGHIISDNIIENNEDGIIIRDSARSKVYGNLIRNNTDGGIHAWVVNNNSIYENTVENNGGDGMNLYASIHNVVYSNLVKNNDLNGLAIYATKYTIIVGNTVEKNSYGVVIYDDAGFNTIYQNNFIDNKQNVRDDVFNNIWDNGQFGNYWSDYTGTDDNGDDIGDTSYVYSEFNHPDFTMEDQYPLMFPWNGDIDFIDPIEHGSSGESADETNKNGQNTDESPGFELVILVFAVAFVLFWKQGRKI